MGLRLEIVSRQRDSLGSRSVKKFGPDGGSIGRSLDSDWCLPDSKRFLSSCHACIDFRSGSYYVVDTSTNGVFVNGAQDAVGKGNPQCLFPGDRIRIGDYEMEVSIDPAPGEIDVLEEIDHIDPVEVRQRVEAPEPAIEDLIDATEITGVGIQMVLDEDEADTLTSINFAAIGADDDEDGLSLAAQLVTDTIPSGGTTTVSGLTGASGADTDAEPDFELRLEETSSRPAPASDAASGAGAAAAVAAAAIFEPATDPLAGADRAGIEVSEGPLPEVDAWPSAAEQATPAAGKPSQAGLTDNDSAAALVAAFCQGAGLKPIPMRPDDARDMFYRLGQAMYSMVGGVTNSLRLRAVQKARLRQSQTMIQPSLNNPLKFCNSAHDGLVKLLSPASDRYLEPIAAVEDAFADLNGHQRILFAVLPKVLDNYIRQLDPEALEERFSKGKRNRLMGAAQKLKYWDLYRDVYAVVVNQASDELPEAFLDALAEAYEKEARAARAGDKAGISGGAGASSKTGNDGSAGANSASAGTRAAG